MKFIGMVFISIFFVGLNFSSTSLVDASESVVITNNVTTSAVSGGQSTGGSTGSVEAGGASAHVEIHSEVNGVVVEDIDETRDGTEVSIKKEVSFGTTSSTSMGIISQASAVFGEDISSKKFQEKISTSTPKWHPVSWKALERVVASSSTATSTRAVNGFRVHFQEFLKSLFSHVFWFK